MIEGIDISKWQGDFDIDSCRADFCIIKAGGSDDGFYIDSQLLNNYTKYKNAGIPVGIYWYTRALSVKALQAEIQYLLDMIRGLQFELPIFLDLEEDTIKQLAGTYAFTWVNGLAAAGYYPGVYSSYSWYMDVLKDFYKTVPYDQIWLALWMSGTDPEFPCGIWQNGHITVNGAEVDHDYMFADYSFIKRKGLNGFKMEKQFLDVTPDRSDYKAIRWLANQGGVQGYKDGTYRPDQPVTRGQIANILWRLAGKPET